MAAVGGVWAESGLTRGLRLTKVVPPTGPVSEENGVTESAEVVT